MGNNINEKENFVDFKLIKNGSRGGTLKTHI